jgi:hypothetical protein
LNEAAVRNAAFAANNTNDSATSYLKAPIGSGIIHWPQFVTAEEIEGFYASPPRVMYEKLDGQMAFRAF